MKIKFAKFLKGIVGTDDILENSVSQVAFIGRSNVGKSSTINALVNQKDLAKTSSFPGRTQQINIFQVNLDVPVADGNSFYLLDLPGYGFAKAPVSLREKILKLIRWYLIDSGCVQKKIVLIIDASVGPTASDLEMLDILKSENKNVVVVANKVDKIRPSDKLKQLKKIQEIFPEYKVIPFSAEKKIGVEQLLLGILD